MLPVPRGKDSSERRLSPRALLYTIFAASALSLFFFIFSFSKRGVSTVL